MRVALTLEVTVAPVSLPPFMSRRGLFEIQTNVSLPSASMQLMRVALKLRSLRLRPPSFVSHHGILIQPIVLSKKSSVLIAFCFERLVIQRGSSGKFAIDLRGKSSKWCGHNKQTRCTSRAGLGFTPKGLLRCRSRCHLCGGLGKK